MAVDFTEIRNDGYQDNSIFGVPDSPSMEPCFNKKVSIKGNDDYVIDLSK